MSLQDPIDSPGAAFRSDAVVGTVGAVAGLRNTRALLALSASLFIGVLVSGLLGRLGLAGALLGGLALIVTAAPTTARVYPSGAARAASVVPMFPAAPG